MSEEQRQEQVFCSVCDEFVYLVETEEGGTRKACGHDDGENYLKPDDYKELNFDAN